VPNSVAVGPDGAYYVGELTGVPFVPESSNVWRVVPGEEPQVYCMGFNFILDLDFDRRGNLYVLEHTSAPFPTGEGTLYRVARDCSRRPVATGLTNPSSVTIGPDGDAYVSNFGTSPDVGEVIRVDLRRRGARDR
jgi:sugar lactone lactonase YvrE